MSVASNYSKAFFEAFDGKEKDNEKASADLHAFAGFLQSNADLRTVLLGPVVTQVEKEKVLDVISEKAGFADSTKEFLLLILRKGRLDLLLQISDSLDRVLVEAKSGVLGEMGSADILPDEVVKEFETLFTKKLGKKVQFKQKRDPDLLAGVRVTVEGKTYDGSLRAQLNQVRERLIHPPSKMDN